MNKVVFQKIYECLVPVLPSNWENIVFYAGYTSGSYSMKYYYKTADGEYKDCFSQTEVPQNQIVLAFMKIDKVLYPERTSVTGKSPWNVLTMRFDSKGKVDVDFDYSVIDESRIEYEKKWYEKYIG